jgi:hypothetical protein
VVGSDARASTCDNGEIREGGGDINEGGVAITEGRVAMADDNDARVAEWIGVQIMQGGVPTSAGGTVGAQFQTGADEPCGE